MPRPVQPDLIRGYYATGLLHALAPMKRAVEAAVYPVLPSLLESARAERERHDSGEAGRARAAVELAKQHFFDNFRDVKQLAAQVGRQTSDFQKGQLQRQLRTAVSVEVPIRDAKLGPKLEMFTERNVALIRTIPERYFSEIEKLTLDAVEQGRRWESLAEDLQDRFDVSESRAQLIARDQVGKFYGSLAEARQTELGISSYIWRTVGDNRVREEHEDRNGEEFEWDDPPDEEPGDGHPGQPVNCRCWAEPNLQQVLDDLDL
jgi:SPP1 gp7 family putative phage head morphogenesis protein